MNTSTEKESFQAEFYLFSPTKVQALRRYRVPPVFQERGAPKHHETGELQLRKEPHMPSPSDLTLNNLHSR